MKSLEGKLLIASPRMSDPRFERAVILVLHHDETSAVGVVLNRPMSAEARGPWQLLDFLASETNRSVQIGGPVEGPIIVLHQNETADGKTQGGVFVVQEQDQLKKLVEQQSDSPTPLRFFIGHAGWGEGQLEDEVASGAWLTTAAAPGFVFADHDDMWLAAMRESGRSFYREVLGIQGFPADACAN